MIAAVQHSHPQKIMYHPVSISAWLLLLLITLLAEVRVLEGFSIATIRQQYIRHNLIPLTSRNIPSRRILRNHRLSGAANNNDNNDDDDDDDHNNNNAGGVELEQDEPLSVLFQRALVLQRAGNLDEASEHYQLFCKAALQCDVDPAMYAEVRVNMGAIALRRQEYDVAEGHLKTALEHRTTNMGTAHVNLAVCYLQQATRGAPPRQQALEYLRLAKDHCTRVIREHPLGQSDPTRSVETATRLLADIDRMLSQVNSGGSQK